MPLDDRNFDVVFSKDSIVHIPDKVALAQDVFRVLKPNGWFVASDWLIGHDDEPSPEMVLTMQESVEKFFSDLGVGHLRELAVAKLEGYSNAELARRFECSERTIERRLHLIREKSLQESSGNHEHSPTETSDRSAGAD